MELSPKKRKSIKKKKPSIPFSDDEVRVLLQLVSDHISIIEPQNAPVGAPHKFWKRKAEAWDTIASDFQASGVGFRDSAALKNKWTHMKMEARKEAARATAALTNTEGEPYENVELPEVVQRVLDLCNKTSVRGHIICFDDDDELFADNPLNEINNPSNGINNPSNIINNPSNGITKPSNGNNNPSNGINNPSNRINKPSNGIKNPSNGINSFSSSSSESDSLSGNDPHSFTKYSKVSVKQASTQVQYFKLLSDLARKDDRRKEEIRKMEQEKHWREMKYLKESWRRDKERKEQIHAMKLRVLKSKEDYWKQLGQKEKEVARPLLK